MLDLLARVVIGVVAAGVVGATAYAVYKVLTAENAKEEINEQIADDEQFQDAFKAVLKEKIDNDETFSFEVLDEWDEPLGEVDVQADETTLEVGEIIMLRDAC